MRYLIIISCLLCSLAQAQEFSYGPNGARAGPVPLTPQMLADGRVVYSALGTGGNVNAAASLSATVEGRSVGMTLNRQLGWQLLGNALARSLPQAAVGMAVFEVASAVRASYRDGSLFLDPGVEPVEGGTALRWSRQDNQPPFYSTSSAAAAAALASLPPIVDNGRCAAQYTQTFFQEFPDGDNGAAEVRWSTTYTQVPGEGTCTAQNDPDDDTRVFASTGSAGSSCPASIDASNPAFNVPAGAPVGPDGLCPTARYNHAPASVAQVADRVTQYGDRARAAEIAREATQLGQDPSVGAGDGTLTGPASSVAPPRVSTTTNPDGSTSTTSQQRQANITYNNNTYTYNISNATTTTNQGGTTTTTETGDPEIEVCGLPGKPPCKIDETGTPSGGGVFDGANEGLDQHSADIRTRILDTLDYEPPTWTWTFQLPSGCTAVSLGPLSAFVEDVDVCRFQPMIHDLMSVVWVLGALVGCCSLFYRTLLG